MLTPNSSTSPWRLPDVSAATIPCPIIRLRHHWSCFYFASDVIEGALLCWMILYRRRRRIHQSRRCRYAKWDTVNIFRPNFTYFILLCLYCRRPHCSASLMLSASYTSPIILNLFYFPHRLSFILYPIFVTFSHISSNSLFYLFRLVIILTL